MEDRVPPVTMDYQAKMVNLVTQEDLVKMVKTDTLVDQDPKVFQDHQAMQELLAKTVTQEAPDRKVILEHRAIQVVQVNQDYPERRATFPVQLDQPDNLAKMVTREALDLKAIPDQLVILVTLDYLDPKV